MSFVTCNQQNQLFEQGIMIVKVGYNMADDKAKTANQQQIQAFSGKRGLPDLSTPLMVENVTNAQTSHLIDNGKGVIVPPDTYISFQISFGCQVGFGFGIDILPSDISIVDNNLLILPRASVPSSNQWLTTSQYAFCTSQNNGQYDHDMILVYDDHFGNHPLNAQIAAHSYQIRITCTPLLNWTDSNGKTYSVSKTTLDVPAAPPPTLNGLVLAGQGDVNVHGGTVTGSGTSGQTYGSCDGYKTDDANAVSCVFDVFVINQKYYSAEYYTVFDSNDSGGGLND